MDTTAKMEEEGPMLDVVPTSSDSKSQQNNMMTHTPTVQYSYKAKAVLAQSLMAAATFLLSASIGMPIGFPTILLPQIQSENSSIPTSEETGSWIASIHSAGTPVGSLLSGPFMEQWGRRTALRASVLPFVAGWACMATAQSHTAIYVARILAGFAVGLAAAPAQVLLGEVAEPRIRGVIVGGPVASYSLGILLIYVLGISLSWRTVAVLASFLPLCALLALSFLPESPHWLARVGRRREAIKALTWLRGGNSALARAELAVLAARQEKEKEETLRNAGRHSHSHRWWSSWRDSPLLSRSVLKPLIIVNVFNVLQILSGTAIIIVYALSVIELAEGSYQDKAPRDDEDTTPLQLFAAVLTAIVRTIVTVITCGLLLMVGRRPLAISSGLGSAAAFIFLGSWVYAAPDPSFAPWLPTTLVMTYVACNTFGFFVLPGLMIGEMLSAKARGQAGGITITVINLTLFATTKVYPQAAHLLKPYGVFWFFGGFTLLTTLFVFLFVPETKGKSLAEIEDYFIEDNVLWVTRQRSVKKDNKIISEIAA